MIVLGIDAAIRRTGYGVVEIKSLDDMKVLDCGVIDTPQKAPHSECLRRIFGGVAELIGKFSPDAAAIEGAFFQKNVRTAMILSLARGAAITAAATAGVPIFEYAPRKAKKAVVGTGMASKNQVATMISSFTGIGLDKVPLDSTDALAIAICHGQNEIRGENGLVPPKMI